MSDFEKKINEALDTDDEVSCSACRKKAASLKSVTYPSGDGHLETMTQEGPELVCALRC